MLSPSFTLNQLLFYCSISDPMSYLSNKRRQMNSCSTLEVMSITTTEVSYHLLIHYISDMSSVYSVFVISTCVMGLG